MSGVNRSVVLVTAALLALGFASSVGAQSPSPGGGTPAAAQAPATGSATATPAPAPKPAVVAPKRFASADDAVHALVTALRANDTKALIGVLGSQGRTLISSGDAVVDREARERFLQAYDATSRLVSSGKATVLRIGQDDWPFPIPVVQDGGGWRFDATQGREEIIARRIGRNELNTIQVCLAYVDAQREYYSEDRNFDGVLEYAMQFASTPGKREGLYWPTEPGQRPSPLGDLVARAQAKGYQLGKTAGPAPFHGYLFRILTKQGPAARDGAYDYVVRNHMIAGFGLVAFPADYGISGVMTFIVNHDGVVYQKDLGPTTKTIAASMRMFNPDKTWSKVDVPEM
ncbi:MAG TPA: DUF2950 domain-containing protein [Methylomirabilota bacterium]|nr:DUF2950 domain-containing protein [Methylomirabilota bacterium]